MAKTPEAVRSLLERVWKPARARALADRDALQALIAEEGGNFTLAPWDWRYYAEILRQRRANFDDAAIKPYLVLDHMIEAAFDCATRLFGITFSERKDIPVWHPDVRVWEVKDAAGQHKALFYGDYFARSSKRSGAWMTSLRDQQKLDGEIAPLIINVCNFARGANAGSFLHGLLEWAGRQGFDRVRADPTAAADLIARRCNLRGWSHWIGALAAWLPKWLSTPLRLPNATPVCLRRQ